MPRRSVSTFRSPVPATQNSTTSSCEKPLGTAGRRDWRCNEHCRTVKLLQQTAASAGDFFQGLGVANSVSNFDPDFGAMYVGVQTMFSSCPNLRRRPRMARPPTPPAARQLRPGRQRFCRYRRFRQSRRTRRPVLQAQLGQDARPLPVQRQPVTQATLARCIGRRASTFRRQSPHRRCTVSSSWCSYQTPDEKQFG